MLIDEPEQNVQLHLSLGKDLSKTISSNSTTFQHDAGEAFIPFYMDGSTVSLDKLELDGSE